MTNTTVCTAHASVTVVTSSLACIVIQVPDHYSVDESINITTLLQQPTSLVKTNISISVRQHARVTIKDDTSSLHTSGTLHKTVEVIVHEGAQVHMQTKQHATTGTTVFAEYIFVLYKNSSINVTSQFTDSLYTKASVNVHLREQGANAAFKGGYLLRDNQHIAIESRLSHTAPNCTSSLRLHGALLGAAKAKYNGTIALGPQAGTTNAEQYNKNLLLSKGAQAVSVPNLEVETNDVQCRHGSAVGRFDEHVQFYMQSRGLSQKNAEELLLKGFFAEVDAKFF